MEDHSPASKDDLAMVQAVLKADIDAVQTALKADIDSVQTVLKADIDSVQTALKADIDAAETSLKATLKEDIAQLRSEMNHQYNDIVERISDSQTELLKAFYGYAQGNNKRVAELEGNEGAFRSRLATIEDRILEVEKRLNMPPAA